MNEDEKKIKDENERTLIYYIKDDLNKDKRNYDILYVRADKDNYYKIVAGGNNNNNNNNNI